MAHTRFFHSRKQFVKIPDIVRHSQMQELDLKIIPHAHLQALVDGRGDTNEYLTVAFRVLVGASLTVLADSDGEKTLEQAFQPAIDALLSIGERYERLKKFGLNGDELMALKEALNLTDELQDVSTKKQQAQMYMQVKGFVGGFDYTMKNLRRLKEIRKK